MPVNALALLYKMHKMHKMHKNICKDYCTMLYGAVRTFLEFTLLYLASYASSTQNLDLDFKAFDGFPYPKSCSHFSSTSVESWWK